MVIDIAANRVDKQEGTTDRVRGGLELLEEVGEDQNKRVTDALNIGCGEELIDWEVLHDHIVLGHFFFFFFF